MLAEGVIVFVKFIEDLIKFVLEGSITFYLFARELSNKIAQFNSLT